MTEGKSRYNDNFHGGKIIAIDDYSDNAQTTGYLPTGGAVHGTLEVAGDTDWFRVDLDTDHAYGFTATMADGSEPTIYVWNETAHYVYYSNYPGIQNSNELVNPFAVYYPGSYYVQVTGARTGAYTIGMQVAPDDIGNSAASAWPLTAAAPVAARFDYAFDGDPFRIAAVAGTTYTVTLDSDSGSIGNAVYLSLDSVDGPVKSSYSGAPVRYTFTVDATRDYVVTATMASFDPPTGGSLPYHVSLTVNGDLRLAAIASSATVDGAIRVTYDGMPRLGYGIIELVDTYGQVVDTWTPSDARLRLDGNTLTLASHAGAIVPGTYTLKYGSHVLTDATGTGLRPSSFDTVAVTKGAADGSPAPSPNPTPTPNPSPGAGAGDGGTVTVGTGSADVAVYAGTAADYTIVRIGATAIVTKAGALKSDTLIGFERVKFTGSDDVVALSLDGDLGKAFRLYTAAFDRAPDKVGLGFWLHSAESGVGLSDMARGFIGSDEFAKLYGASTTDEAFVAALYRNVLHRPGEASGVAFWEDALARGADRADTLAAFSESGENHEQAAALIGNGILYTSYG